MSTNSTIIPFDDIVEAIRNGWDTSVTSSNMNNTLSNLDQPLVECTMEMIRANWSVEYRILNASVFDGVGTGNTFVDEWLYFARTYEGMCHPDGSSYTGTLRLGCKAWEMMKPFRNTTQHFLYPHAENASFPANHLLVSNSSFVEWLRTGYGVDNSNNTYPDVNITNVINWEHWAVQGFSANVLDGKIATLYRSFRGYTPNFERVKNRFYGIVHHLKAPLLHMYTTIKSHVVSNAFSKFLYQASKSRSRSDGTWHDFFTHQKRRSQTRQNAATKEEVMKNGFWYSAGQWFVQLNQNDWGTSEIYRVRTQYTYRNTSHPHFYMLHRNWHRDRQKNEGILKKLWNRLTGKSLYTGFSDVNRNVSLSNPVDVYNFLGSTTSFIFKLDNEYNSTGCIRPDDLVMTPSDLCQYPYFIAPIKLEFWPDGFDRANPGCSIDPLVYSKTVAYVLSHYSTLDTYIDEHPGWKGLPPFSFIIYKVETTDHRLEPNMVPCAVWSPLPLAIIFVGALAGWLLLGISLRIITNIQKRIFGDPIGSNDGSTDALRKYMQVDVVDVYKGSQ